MAAVLCFQSSDDFSGDAVGLAAEKGNDVPLAIPDGGVVDAGTPGERALLTLGFQFFACTRRAEEVDVAGRGNRVTVVAIAGVGKSGVSKGKKETAVADMMSIDHIGSDDHREQRVPWSDRHQTDADQLQCSVAAVHCRGGLFGEQDRLLCVVPGAVGLGHAGSFRKRHWVGCE